MVIDKKNSIFIRLAIIIAMGLLLFSVPIRIFTLSELGPYDYDPNDSVAEFFGGPTLFMWVMYAGLGAAVWFSPVIVSGSSNLGKVGMILGGVASIPVGLFLGLWLGGVVGGLTGLLLGQWAVAPGLALGLLGIPFITIFVGALLGRSVGSLLSKIVGYLR